uniref:Uncharacterized protein n=1 Tax=Anopheles culicifacies TaxID=139723 RepID=A0A182MML8_9DIPT
MTRLKVENTVDATFELAIDSSQSKSDDTNTDHRNGSDSLEMLITSMTVRDHQFGHLPQNTTIFVSSTVVLFLCNLLPLLLDWNINFVHCMTIDCAAEQNAQ